MISMVAKLPPSNLQSKEESTSLQCYQLSMEKGLDINERVKREREREWESEKKGGRDTI